jgi:PRTRC genetic system protein E
LKSDRQSDDAAALSTPLSITGTPTELDDQLSQRLVEFVEAYPGLSSTLKSAKEQGAAAKAGREAARKATNSKSHSGSSRSATSSPAQVPTQDGAKESSDDSQSSPAPTQAAAEGGGPGAPELGVVPISHAPRAPNSRNYARLEAFSNN